MIRLLELRLEQPILFLLPSDCPFSGFLADPDLIFEVRHPFSLLLIKGLLLSSHCLLLSDKTLCFSCNFFLLSSKDSLFDLDVVRHCPFALSPRLNQTDLVLKLHFVIGQSVLLQSQATETFFFVAELGLGQLELLLKVEGFELHLGSEVFKDTIGSAFDLILVLFTNIRDLLMLLAFECGGVGGEGLLTLLEVIELVNDVDESPVYLSMLIFVECALLLLDFELFEEFTHLLSSSFHGTLVHLLVRNASRLELLSEILEQKSFLVAFCPQLPVFNLKLESYPVQLAIESFVFIFKT